MGRKQLQKKINKGKTNEDNIGTYNKKQAIKIFSIIIGLFIGFYIITSLFMTKEDELLEENNIVEIQYQKIIAGELFHQNETQYFVVLYSFESDDGKYIDLIIDKNFNENTLKIYKVNLDEGFNNSIISDESNNDSDIAKLKVKGTTLIQVNDKEIKLFVEGLDKIEEYFEN